MGWCFLQMRNQRNFPDLSQEHYINILVFIIRISHAPSPGAAHRMFYDHFKVGVFRPKIVLKINRGREKVNSLQGICATRERIVGFNLYYSIINCRVWACMRAQPISGKPMPGKHDQNLHEKKKDKQRMFKKVHK